MKPSLKPSLRANAFLMVLAMLVLPQLIVVGWSAMERDIGVIVRSPLDEGALTGRINPHSQFEPTEFRARYFKGDRKKQVAERVAAIERDLGIQDGVMPEVALRFCLSHPVVSSVIPGMRTRANVESNYSIPGKGALPEKVLAILRKHAWEKNFYGA